MKTSKILIIIFLIAIIFRFVYFTYTDYSTRGYDVDGHLSYIELIRTNYIVPKASDCWECYQPPLYYLLSGTVVNSINFFGVTNKETIYQSLQIFSILLSILTLYFGLSFLKLFLKGKRLILSFALISLPLITIMHSVRISNDSLQYLLATIIIYMLAKYYLSQNDKDLITSLIITIIALYTKQSTLALFPLIVFLVFITYLKHKDIKKIIVQLLISGIILIFGFILVNLSFFTSSESRDWLVGPITSLNSALAVGNNIENYIYFDFEKYFNYMNISPWEDISGRQYFLNYILKSSQFGEFKFTNELLRTPVLISSIATLILLILTFIKLAFNKIKNNLTLIFPISVSLLHILSLIYLRYKYPFACQNDFRFILPIVPSLSLIYVSSMPNKKGILFYLFLIPPILLILSGLVIILIVYFSEGHVW